MDVTCWEQESPAIPVEDVANKARGQPVDVVQKLKMIMKILCNRSRLNVMKTMFQSGPKDWCDVMMTFTMVSLTMVITRLTILPGCSKVIF